MTFQDKIIELEDLLSKQSEKSIRLEIRVSEMEKKLADPDTLIQQETTPSVAREEHSVSETFLELKERWRQETAFTSSPTELFLHSAYQQIIGLGPKAIPLVITELRDEPGLWLWALRAMTREDPVPKDFQGGTRELAEIWLEWAGERWG